MRIQGTLLKWDDERGFGYIRTRESRVVLPVHRSEFPRGQRRPQIGDPLSFDIRTGAGAFVAESPFGPQALNERLNWVRDRREDILKILEVRGAGPDHPWMAHVQDSRYLKAVFCRVF